MPRLHADLKMEFGSQAPFGRASANPISRRIPQFLAQEKAARDQAAKAANARSRGSIKHTRPLAPPRPGRSSTQGRLGDFVKWSPSADGQVELNVAELNRTAPHWIIQEIGTGQRAIMRTGGQALPKGRPKKGASYVRTVRSQKGRHIRAAFVWASGPGGTPTPAGMGRGQQLIARAGMPGGGAPLAYRGMTIRREIKGQHFARKGAQEGFRQYETNVLAAARSAFRKAK